MKYKIQIFLCIKATPLTALGENNVYTWVDLPTGKEFDGYSETRSYIEDLKKSFRSDLEYKIVKLTDA